MQTQPQASSSKPLWNKVLAAVSIVTILGSAYWIYRTQFATPGINQDLHRAVGEVMAEETSRVVGHLGHVVIVTMDSRQSPEIQAQVKAFEKHLKLLGGITIKDKLVLDPGENPKYRPGSGLSAKRFLKIARKNGGADAIISFVGAPQISDAELAQIKSTPKFIAETHSPEKITNLFEKKILLSAIVPRFEFPAPGPRKPQTSRQWFDRYFQILAPESVLPKQEDTP